MTQFEGFALPQGVGEIAEALRRAFDRHGLVVPRCQLVGSQTNTLIDVIPELEGLPGFASQSRSRSLPRALDARTDRAIRRALSGEGSEVM